MQADLDSDYVKDARKKPVFARRYRTQDGTVERRSGGKFALRYYKSDPVTNKRIKCTEPLAVSIDADVLERERARRHRMKEINSAEKRIVEVGQGAGGRAMTVGDFFEREWQPFISRTMRWSTAQSYLKRWKMYCKKLEDKPISPFLPGDAAGFLRNLVDEKDLGRSTIAHIKSVCSGLFTYAIEKNVRPAPNPWSRLNVKVRKAPKGMVEYTREERDAILAVPGLSNEAKALFALISVLGLRPSESAAMRWERIDTSLTVVHVTEAASFGHLDALKTEKSKRTLPITETLLPYLKAWHAECKWPAAGLLFTRRQGVNEGKPIKTNDYCRHHIVPIVLGAIDPKTRKRITPQKPVGWKGLWPICVEGLYSGRHLAHRTVWDATHDLVEVTAVSGNSPIGGAEQLLARDEGRRLLRDACRGEAAERETGKRKNGNGKRKK